MTTPMPPGFEELRERVLRAYHDLGEEVTRWGLAAGRSRPGDILEQYRRQAAGRRLAKRELERMLARLAHESHRES